LRYERNLKDIEKHRKMIIRLNKQIIEVPEETSIYELVLKLKHDPSWSLVSINNQLIRHSIWENVLLHDDDIVEIFSYNNFGAGI